jgi:NAD+ dependent glucose-6-phosphate dehydrogenase
LRVKGVELIGRREAVWLSERNFVQQIEKSLLTEEPWVLVYGISNNPRRFWDIEHARRVLGYEPQDAASALIGDEDASQMK